MGVGCGAGNRRRVISAHPVLHVPHVVLYLRDLPTYLLDGGASYQPLCPQRSIPLGVVPWMGHRPTCCCGGTSSCTMTALCCCTAVSNVLRYRAAI